MSLTTVLGHVTVDNSNNICTDGSREDVGESKGLLGLLSGLSVNLRNNGTSSGHLKKGRRSNQKVLKSLIKGG